MLYTARKPKGPVLDTPLVKRLQPPPTSGVLSRPNFGDWCTSAGPAWFWEWERISVRIAAWLYPCVYPHSHPQRLDSLRVVLKSRKGAWNHV